MREIDETPDSTRPRNVWPRLLAFAFVVVGAGVAVIACVAAFARSVPPRELTVPLAQLEPGRPQLLAVTTWGADRGGHTFGAWVVIMPESGDAHAYLSRDPATGCQVVWRVVAQAGRPTHDAFVDACDASVEFGLDGTPSGTAAPPPRALDHFEVAVANGKLTVPIEQVQLGDCVPGATGAAYDSAGCSSAGAPRFKNLPAGPLAGDEGLRQH